MDWVSEGAVNVPTEEIGLNMQAQIKSSVQTKEIKQIIGMLLWTVQQTPSSEYIVARSNIL